VIEGVNNEKLEIIIDRVFGIMERTRLLPPAPRVIQEAGGETKTEFVSILTQMQRMVGLGQIERTISFVSSLAATYPEARHKIDAMAVVDEYASRAGAPAKIIITTAEANERMMGEQEDTKQAALIEQMNKLAPVGKVAVDAARVTADLPAGAIPAVEALVPEMPR